MHYDMNFVTQEELEDMGHHAIHCDDCFGGHHVEIGHLPRGYQNRILSIDTYLGENEKTFGMTWNDLRDKLGMITLNHACSVSLWQLIQLSELQGEDLVMASTKLLLKRKFMWPKTPKLKTKKLVHLGTNIADALASMKVDSSTNKERKLGTLYFCHPTNLAVLDGKQM